jgi:hypothetical protein
MCVLCNKKKGEIIEQENADLRAKLELAFFNYDNDGSEQDVQEWGKRRKQWKQFKSYLENLIISEDSEVGRKK